MSEAEKTKGVSTIDWLIKLGALRPMACASNTVLVLGRWHKGFYPIEWSFHYEGRDSKKIEEWKVFGVPTKFPLCKEECERIMSFFDNDHPS